MKYMTFNSSCSYAGIANMLETEGLDVEDYEIATGMELPYLIDKCDDGFISGSMLQSKKWFDIFLKKKGYELIEECINKQDIFSKLKNKECAMLGLRIDESHKHAVVFKKIENHTARFINNKRKDSEEPNEILLNECELMGRLDDDVVIASLKSCDITEINMIPLIKSSIINLDELKEKIIEFCTLVQSREKLMQSVDTLFRPILLDSVAVLEMIAETSLVCDIKTLQKKYIQIVFIDKLEQIALKDFLDMDLLQSIFNNWKEIMKNRIYQMEQNNCLSG